MFISVYILCAWVVFRLAWVVFLTSRDCCVALPVDAMGLSAVCDCGIF